MEPQVSVNVMFLDTAKQVWTALQEMYFMEKMYPGSTNYMKIFSCYRLTARG